MNSTTEIQNSDLASLLKGKSGYLPCQFIEMALKEGMITSKIPIDTSQIQPVSLDLRLGQRAYRIQCSFLPENEPVDTRLKDLTLYEFDISNGGILEKNAIYLYTGVQAEYELGFLTITPSFAPGYYNYGDGKDLGSPLEFKTEVQMSFNISDSTHLGMSYNHISNASLGDKNPGANSYMLNFLKHF